MKNINSIDEFRLSDFLSKEIIEEREFNYSGVDGIAELLGWHLVFFRDLENLNCTSAIHFNDANYNDELRDFVNLFLAKLSIDLKVGDSLEEIVSKYGQPFSYDEIFEEMRRYNYLFNNNSYFVSFGVDNNNGLISIEIINNKKILDGILNCEWRHLFYI